MQKNESVDSPNIYKVVILFSGYKEKDTVVSPIYSIASIERSDEPLHEQDIRYWT